MRLRSVSGVIWTERGEELTCNFVTFWGFLFFAPEGSVSGVIWTERGDVPGRGKEGMLGSGRWGKLGMLRQGRGELLVSMGLSSSWSEPSPTMSICSSVGSMIIEKSRSGQKISFNSMKYCVCFAGHIPGVS